MQGLIVIKRVAKPVFLAIYQPFKTVGFILVKMIGVPAYRGIFFVRRFVNTILLPAKHRFFYLLSNRYTVHALMIILVGIIGITNFQTRDVRAETFGQKSILYSLVSVDDSETVEVVEAGKSVLIPGGPSSYFSDTTLDTRTQFHQNELEQSIVPTQPQIAASRSSVETYVVKDGDTLGRISVRFHLSISTILSANGLTLRSTLRPGDTLKILPSDGIMYTVKRGDTLSKIANAFNIDATEIASANQFFGNASLKIGTEIILPGATQTAAPAAIARKPVSIKDIITNTPIPKPSGSTSVGWVWPTNWHVITQYFSWKHTGVDIDGDFTTFSMAAHDGVVSYTGWRNGYGLTVEVDHGNGLKTRYGHNSKIFVSTGDVVVAGQHLAQTGTTGNSTGTHLHFEVILNGKFQNPLSYIR
ncbi:MAG: LysM peptidoglycan-binding domain-containing protein [Candidatus Uhrbacteria bacterium]|nr:LysM peptidoglycan-binding domain-containing protein [Candidatus Uhrbacteria bacterium]